MTHDLKSINKRNWLERHLEDPFLQAELFKAQTTKSADPGFQGKGVLKVLTLCAAAYTLFCAYCFIKYLA